LDAIIERISDPLEFKQFYTEKYYAPTLIQQLLHSKENTKSDPNAHKQIHSSDLSHSALLPQTSRALIFDSVYDKYRGVVCYVKVVDGAFKAGTSYHLIHSDNDFVCTEVGHFTPEYHKDPVLTTGQIGYIVTGQKSVRDAQIGDTIMSKVSDHSL
jgi:hypothetical protein